MLYFTDITHNHLHQDLVGPRIFTACKKFGSRMSSTGGYPILIMIYARSPFRDSEISLRVFVGLVEKNFNWF